MSYPWDEWIPGALNKRQMRTLLEDGYVTSSGSEPVLDHSSMDLTLSDEAYKMAKGSVKPSHDKSYDWFISKKTRLADPFSASDDGAFHLEAKTTYVFKLKEKLESSLRGSGIHGQATAKSSVGRVDVLARLIVDGMKTFERFDPSGLDSGSGDLYLEITPITFPVTVKSGTSLSQLRFFYGSPKDVRIKGPELFKTIFPGAETPDESLSVDLTEAIIGDPKGAFCRGVAFCADSTASADTPVPLWPVAEKPDPCKHWTVAQADEAKRLLIEPDKFYILRSKERIWVPSGIAVYCRASDETIGEMRIHYAGFVHPYFGLFRQDGSKGTPLIFEVRGHQVRVSLADKERMANLIFYRMSEDAEEPTAEEKLHTYGNQNLQLSKFFAPWPKELKRNDNGTVEAIR